MKECLKKIPKKKILYQKSAICLFFFTSYLFFISLPALPATESLEMPEEIMIENKVYDVDRKPPVWFSHQEHAEGYVDSCDRCHHEYENGKNVWEEGQPVKKCLVCHSPSKSEGKIKKLNIAFHKNCKGCHRKLAKEGDTEAPFMQCTDCHERD